jgi:hypothetical protein
LGGGQVDGKRASRGCALAAGATRGLDLPIWPDIALNKPIADRQMTFLHNTFRTADHPIRARRKGISP